LHPQGTQKLESITTQEPSQTLDALIKLDDYTVQKFCQDLIEKKQFKTLSNFIQSNKRVHRICQPLLKAIQPIYLAVDDYSHVLLGVGTIEQLIKTLDINPKKIQRERTNALIYISGDSVVSFVRWSPNEQPRQGIVSKKVVDNTGLYGLAFIHIYGSGFMEFSNEVEAQEHVIDLPASYGRAPTLIIPHLP
jgi:hypothetical protein